MAEKTCWKKTVDNKDGMHFYKRNPFSGIDIGTCVHLLMPSSAFTHDLKIHVKTFERQKGITNDKTFKTKTKALVYAKKYMKKHNTCGL